MKNDCITTLQTLGITYQDAVALRRISMTLHRWHEMECGTDGGCIERDETTGKPVWLSASSGRRSSIADRETGALTRLASIMARYPALRSYVQGDPRGASLYILRDEDIPGGARHAVDQRMPIVDSYYSRGIAVYK